MNVLFNVAGHERSCLTRQVMNVLSNFAFPEWPPSGGLGFAARSTIKGNLKKIEITPPSIRDFLKAVGGVYYTLEGTHLFTALKTTFFTFHLLFLFVKR